jgi:hypothetical protein
MFEGWEVAGASLRDGWELGLVNCCGVMASGKFGGYSFAGGYR